MIHVCTSTLALGVIACIVMTVRELRILAALLLMNRHQRWIIKNTASPAVAVRLIEISSAAFRDEQLIPGAKLPGGAHGKAVTIQANYGRSHHNPPPDN
jgi:hypothetical protein